MNNPDFSKILILDFGSQYTQLIARRIRELKVYCEIWPYNKKITDIKKFNPEGIILSGGPSSVFDSNAPKIDEKILELGIPILGICYGMQIISKILEGEVLKADKREYGHAKVNIKTEDILFKDVSKKQISVWMSHGDSVTKLPKDFSVIASTENAKFAGIKKADNKIYALQFHPEVTHTEQGKTIFANFLFNICKTQPTWTMGSFIESSVQKIKDVVGDSKVVLGLSGGVDSSVAAVLIHRAIGDNLTCLFVDNGLLRKDEVQNVEKIFRKNYKINLEVINATDSFLSKLKGIEEPEKKRKIIGNEFISVFEKHAKKIKGVNFLGQGTLYPDVIESVSFKGPSAVIKSHHNVGGLPKKMGLKLIEPFRELFKDEVRQVGKELNMPEEIINRQPFPGPGLAVRILGEINNKRLDILRQADHIMMHEIKEAGWYNKIWQSFCVLLPVKTVGVMGDERTYENVIAIRAVSSIDGMTADWIKLPYELLGVISNRIINEVKGVNRVVYDISSKPPATIEWE